MSKGESDLGRAERYIFLPEAEYVCEEATGGATTLQEDLQAHVLRKI